MLTADDTLQIAIHYYRTGQFDPARHLLRQVLELQPDHAEAFYLLGGIAFQTGDLAQALECFQKAAERNPDCAAYWYDLGCAYLQAGKYQEATAASAQALRVRPDYPEAYNNLGVVCQMTGQLDRALECYEQAIRLAPSYAQAYRNLGKALWQREEKEAALDAFEQVMRLSPDSAEAANDLGAVLEALGKVEEAAQWYRKGLELRPNFPDASYNLATALKEQGLFGEAVAQYRETLRLQPEHAWAYYNLSQLIADGRYTFAPDELERLQILVAADGGLLAERSTRCFALAAVRDEQGSHNEAFSLFQRGNELRRQELREQGKSFDAGWHRAQIDDLIATFDEAYFRKVQGWGRDSNLPVFVLGVPRSGTTLVEQIVSSHPAVFGAGELPGVMQRIMRVLVDRAAPGDPAAPHALPSRAVARDVAAGYLARLERLADGARRVTVKTLDNHLYLGVLATLFPEARVIYCQRDALDVCVSCYFQNFKDVAYSWSLEDIGFYYRQYERLMAHWRRVLPVPILDVRYEDLIAHPEAVGRKMLDFCGLDWHERCLAFYKNPRTVRTSSMVQVRKPLFTQSIGRWKKYKEFLAPLFQALRLPAVVEPKAPQPENQPGQPTLSSPSANNAQATDL